MKAKIIIASLLMVSGAVFATHGSEMVAGAVARATVSNLPAGACNGEIAAAMKIISRVQAQAQDPDAVRSFFGDPKSNPSFKVNKAKDSLGRTVWIFHLESTGPYIPSGGDTTITDDGSGTLKVEHLGY